jgi:hypothetical protein
MVDIRAVHTNPSALAVGGMFDTYFAGINAKDYPPVLALYDPAGALDPGDPAQASKFTHGVSTTVDSDVVIRSISNDAAHRGDVDTRLTFQSRQQAGYGPADAPQETCTRWDNTYELRPNSADEERILRLLQFTDRPC